MFSKLFKRSETKTDQQALLEDGVCVYAIGDIHGRCDLLDRLFTLLREDILKGGFSSLYFVFLGDYIDRGFQSRQVLDLLISQHWGQLNAVFLKGNHEQTMLDFLTAPDVGPQWVEYGGRETLLSYGVQVPEQKSDMVAWERASADLNRALPETHRSFLNSLRSEFQLGECYFVHAGVDPGRPLLEQTDEDRLWIRDKFLSSGKKMEKVIVHGHTPEEYPVWNGRRIGVDTGAYITNRLTAARIENSTVDFIST